jgi:lysylphosphatidylglycerol synthetase-like protein (DUF2156 family)
MTNTTAHPTELEPRAASVLRAIRVLISCYVGLSALTLVVAVLLGGDPDLVPDSVWIRGVIVLASSVLLAVFAARAARGSRSAWRRVWLFAAIMTVAIVVIVAIPGVFPVWMKLEQVACGALLLTVFTLARTRVLRTAFAVPARG